MPHSYLEVVENPRRMGGSGAPRDTLFGVLGHTKYDPMNRSLGGLVISTTKDASPADAAHKVKGEKNTEHHILGPKSKTAIPGVHTGQVPYPGQFMKTVGASVS